MKKIFQSIVLLLLSMFFCGCTTIAKLFRSSGSYQVYVMKSEENSSLAIGKIVGRDARFSPYLMENFKDMLQLHLMAEGYSVKEMPDDKSLRKLFSKANSNSETAEPLELTEKEETKPAVNKIDTTENTSNLKDLLPENLRQVLDKGTVVGFSNVSKETQFSDFLSSNEIKFLSEQLKIRYFIQGAVGNNDSGNLLEEDFNSLVFLKIYDSNGVLKGGITYVVNGRSLNEANLLKEVCRNISNRMNTLVKR
ncbi:lipoprotein [Leptospira mayottensis]|uniref:Lipoprotein n=2 Tax=Leptospira mayottensis TaxID=1137606 RepID=A0AA87SZK4_9LEPT|nr:lipoprotein [Leptospira mayottensis]AXR60323.1 lipoprotein [Leptospira mayottensis]AXR64136.1 lipoprotein [Leptospira mayottensis]AXR67846.1 lipoprotein [Leptospira mayottensis]AZQ03250.1 lipoprotein [Leptospira mayottensis 200901116]EKS00907.1 putative lipoprotein [Leptospira mayottensis 200901122]